MGAQAHRSVRAALFLLLSAVVPACSGPGRGAGSGSTSVATSGTPAPTHSSAPAAFHDPIDVVFDATGAMWVGNYRDSTLERFAWSDLDGLSGTNAIRPSRTITGLGGPNRLAFDAAGTLWVVSWDDDRLRGYDAGALRGTGDVAPAVTIQGPHLGEPTDLAFDARGWVWVANQRSGDIVAYGPSDIATSGAPAPRVILQPFRDGPGTPEAIAFDAMGRLWVSDYYGDEIVAFDPAQLTRSGAPRPRLRRTLPVGSGPIGLKIDGKGRMWVAEAAGYALAVFAPGAHGSASPVLTVEGDDLVMPHVVTFGPDGGIWVPCYNNTVLRYDRAAVEAGRNPLPTLTLR